MPDAGKLLLRPDTPGPYPAMLLLPALGAPSVRALDATAKHLMSVLAQGGIASLRADPLGAGVAELVESYRAHANALAAEREVSSVYLFGHSLGGVLAPLVARDMPLGGVAVYGAPSKRWCEALSEGARRQLALAGLPLEDVEREARHAAELYRLLLREGRSEVPELADCIAARDLDGDTLFGASLALLRELDALDLESAWREVRAPVLAMRGEHDWIVALDDHERIASWADRGEALVVAGIDHDMQLHPSRRVSFAQRGRGGRSDGVAQMLAAWVAARAPVGLP